MFVLMPLTITQTRRSSMLKSSRMILLFTFTLATCLILMSTKTQSLEPRKKSSCPKDEGQGVASREHRNEYRLD